MATGFDALAQAGVNNAQNEASARIQQKQVQRNTLAGLYLNAVQTPLPKTDDPAYKDALAKREKLMSDYVASMGPEQHASFGQHLHGLIFGQPDVAEPVHGNAPEPPPVAAAAPAEAPAPQSDHPFANNPVYASIQEGLNTLGKHLKAGANPVPKQTPDYASLSAAPTAEERATAEAQKLAQIRANAITEAAHIRNLKPPPKGSVQAQRYDAAARGLGYTGYDDPEMSPEDAAAIARKDKTNLLAPHFAVSPATGLMSTVSYDADGNETATPVLDTNGKPFGGFKPDQIKIVNGKYHFTDALTGEIHEVPVTTETTTMMRASGYQPPATPVSTQAPTLDTSPATVPAAASAPTKTPQLTNLNAQIAAGNATSPKLNKKKPISTQAPQVPGQGKVIGQTAGLMDKSDAQQYTKIAEDANAKQEAFTNAQKALSEGSTPSSDQELIYSWVRANVQGAGRMTQAEFKQAGSIGSLDQRAQNWYNMTLHGTLSPEIERMLFADIKRSSETATQMAASMRAKYGKGTTSSQAPQLPAAAPPAADPALVKKLSDALKGQ